MNQNSSTDAVQAYINNIANFLVSNEIKAADEVKAEEEWSKKLCAPTLVKSLTPAHISTLAPSLHHLTAHYLKEKKPGAEKFYYWLIQQPAFGQMGALEKSDFYRAASETLFEHQQTTDALFYLTAAQRYLDVALEKQPNLTVLLTKQQALEQLLAKGEVSMRYDVYSRYLQSLSLKEINESTIEALLLQGVALADGLMHLQLTSTHQALFTQLSPWLEDYRQRWMVWGIDTDVKIYQRAVEVLYPLAKRLQAHEQYEQASSYYTLLLQHLHHFEKAFSDEQVAAIHAAGASWMEPLPGLIPAATAQALAWQKRLKAMRIEARQALAAEQPMDAVQAIYSKGVAGLVKEIAAAVMQLLAEPPCAFSVIGIGSISRLELTPHSDIDLAILLAQAEGQGRARALHNPYFRAFIELLQFSLYGLGDEWIVHENKKQSLGLHIDGGDIQHLQTGQLIKTPEDMAAWVTTTLKRITYTEASQRDSCFRLAYSLQWPYLLYSSESGDAEKETVLTRYQQALRKSYGLDVKDAPIYQQIAQHCLAIHQAELANTFRLSKERIAKQQGIDIKSTLLAPITYWCLDTALTTGILPQEAVTMTILCQALEKSQRVQTSFLNYLKDQWREASKRRFTQIGHCALLEKAADKQQAGWIQALQTKLLQPAYQSAAKLAAQQEALEPMLEHLAAKFAACQHELLNPGIQQAVDACIEETRAYLQRYGTPASHEYLKRLCPELAWQLAIQVLVQRQPVPPPVNYPAGFSIQVNGVRSGEVWLQQAVIEKLFAANGQLKPVPANASRYGRRPVVLIEHQGQTFHAKLYPEMPGVEEAVRLFDHMLFGQGVAQSELFCIRCEKTVYPILFSQHVPGDNLQTLFNEAPNQALEKLTRLDKRRLSEQLLFNLLINPEDGKPDNYILQGEDTYRLVCVDNDHAFVPPIILQNKHRELQVKTIVYCLDQMQDALHPEAIQAFLQHEPLSFLRRWLELLQEREMRYQALFNPKLREDLWQRGRRWFKGNDESVVIPMCFAPCSIAQLYEKWLTLREVLERQPAITAMGLLRQVIPLVGLRYEEAFKKPSAAERFYDLAATLYSTAIAGRYTTLKTGPQLIAQRKVPETAVIQSLPEYSPQRAADELESARIEDASLEAIRLDVEKGHFQRFQALYLDASREKVLQAIDFTKLPLPIQTAIIDVALQGIAFHHLVIKGCAVLTNSQLQQLLAASPGLLQLSLTNCSQITRDGIMELINCLALEQLTLANLPKLLSLRSKNIYLRTSWAMTLPQLTSLDLERCANLQEINLIAPRLQALKLKSLRGLQLLTLQTPALKECLLHTCPSLPQPNLQRLVAMTPELAALAIYDSPPLSFRILAHRLFQNQQWTTLHCQQLIEEDSLNLQGLAVTDEGLTTIAHYGLPVKRIDVRGCQNITRQGLFKLISLPQLESIICCDYTANPKQVTLTGHTSAVYALLVIPDGRVVSGSADNTLRVWDVSTRQSIATLTGHTASVTALLALPDGRVVSGSDDKTLRVWDVSTHQCITTLTGHTAYVTALLALPDGRVVSGSDDNTLRVWDVSTRQCITTLTGHTSTIYALVVLPDGRVVSGSYDNTLRVWDVSARLCIATLTGHTSGVRALLVLPDGRMVSGSWDSTLRVWDVSARQSIATLTGHTDAVTALLALPDGRVVSGSDDNTLRVWDISTRQCIATLTGHTSYVHALLALPDGRVVSGSADNTLRVWSFPDVIFDYSALQALKGKLALLINQEGLRLTVSPAHASLLKLTVETLSSLLYPLKLSLEAATLIITCTDSLKAYHILKHLQALQPASMMCHALSSSINEAEIEVWLKHAWPLTEIQWPSTAALTPAGLQKLVSRFPSLQKLGCYNPVPTPIATLTGHTKAVIALLALPDGRVVSGSDDNTLRVWDVSTRQSIATLTGHTKAIYALLALPDGRVVSGSADYTLRLWDISARQSIAILTEHTGWVGALVVLPDGRVVSGSLDNTLRLWDISARQCIATLRGHTSAVWALVVLPDGRVVSGSYDTTLRVWDISARQSIATLTGHTDWVKTLAVLPDGRVVSGSADKTLRVWDVSARQSIATVEGHTYGVYALLVLPDGRVISGSADKTLRVWDTGIKQLSLLLLDSIRPQTSVQGKQLVVNFNTPNAAAVSLTDVKQNVSSLHLEREEQKVRVKEMSGLAVSGSAELINTYRELIALCFSLYPADTAPETPLSRLTYTCQDANQADDLQAFLRQCWQNRQRAAQPASNSSAAHNAASSPFWSRQGSQLSAASTSEQKAAKIYI